MSQAASSGTAIRDPGYMTYEEFLEAPGPEWSEWVDGRMVPMPNVSLEHYRITRWLGRLFDVFGAGTRGELLGEPFNMKTGPDLPGRSPDLFFLLNEHRDRLRDNHLAGPADIVVEVTSPSTAAIDRGAKYYEYEAGGVTEYWLIDPQRRVAEFYRLGPAGHYELVPTTGGIFESAVLPGMRFPVEWLWTLPSMDVVAATLPR